MNVRWGHFILRRKIDVGVPREHSKLCSCMKQIRKQKKINYFHTMAQPIINPSLSILAHPQMEVLLRLTWMNLDPSPVCLHAFLIGAQIMIIWTGHLESHPSVDMSLNLTLILVRPCQIVHVASNVMSTLLCIIHQIPLSNYQSCASSKLETNS